jgi:phosphoserine phosphatase
MQTRENLLSKPMKSSKIKVVLFDMDGVLVDSNSSWHHVHTYFKTNNDDSVEAYVKGRISDEEFIRRDVSQWKKDDSFIFKKDLETIFSSIQLMKGAKTCIQQLTDHGIIVGIVSAGIDVLADKVASLLDIHLVCANQLLTDDSGRLTGEGIVNVPLMRKDRVVKRISRERHIPLQEIAAVGNSCFDIPLLRYAGLGIAFHPDDDCIIEEADVVIHEKDLRKVLDAVKPFIL